MTQHFDTPHFWNLKVEKIDTPYCVTGLVVVCLVQEVG